KAAAKRVVDELDPADVFTLVAFNDTVTTLAGGVPVGPNRADIKARIDALAAGGNTMLGKALRAAVGHLAPHARDGVNSAVYALTDGVASDAADAEAFAPEAHRQGIAVYAGGLTSPEDAKYPGQAYNPTFLDRICHDASAPGALLVDNMDATKPDGLAAAFLTYLRRRGRVLTANCRLRVEPVPPCELLGGFAQEGRRPLNLRPDDWVPLPNLPPGGVVRFQIEFSKSFVSVAAGAIPVARFHVAYDVPAHGVRGVVVSAVALVEATADPSKERRDPDAERLYQELNGLKELEKADRATAEGNFKGAAAQLRRTTRIFKGLGREDMVEKLEAQARELDAAGPADQDRMVKLGRETKKFQIDTADPPPPAPGPRDTRGFTG
ncbi:MAG TPA: VWA domain-containing protein, partial [Urbifossiella sp.]|nr:VWA domain-containing protein [Urbifossiella sp.]